MASSRKKILDAIREKIAGAPIDPGVYIFKDAAGVVLYVGKAKALRHRVASYFQPAADLIASRGPEIARMIDDLVADVDWLVCDSEVDAMLRENRLIKDIQPRFNERQKDDKSFPYLQISTDEDFPSVQITRQPKSAGAKLFGPFVSVTELRAALPLMQRVFKFRTCSLEVADGDERRRHFRPCILHSIKQCSGPCAARIEKEDYNQAIARFRQFLQSKGSQLRRELETQMKEASAKQDFERAAALRDELRALEGLQDRGLVDEHVQPEVFFIDPADGLRRLGELLSLPETPRTIEAIDIAHLGGDQACGAMACFIDGKPFKNGYRRYKIKSAQGGDDFASIAEVVARRYSHAADGEELFPDVILVDGGAGQLSAAEKSLATLGCKPPTLISLAKRDEEIYTLAADCPIRLPHNDPALRILQSIRDEAHRFVQHYHHILRRKATLNEE